MTSLPGRILSREDGERSLRGISGSHHLRLMSVSTSLPHTNLPPFLPHFPVCRCRGRRGEGGCVVPVSICLCACVCVRVCLCADLPALRIRPNQVDQRCSRLWRHVLFRTDICSQSGGKAEQPSVVVPQGEASHTYRLILRRFFFSPHRDAICPRYEPKPAVSSLAHRCRISAAPKPDRCPSTCCCSLRPPDTLRRPPWRPTHFTPRHRLRLRPAVQRGCLVGVIFHMASQVAITTT